MVSWVLVCCGCLRKLQALRCWGLGFYSCWAGWGGRLSGYLLDCDVLGFMWVGIIHSSGCFAGFECGFGFGVFWWIWFGLGL